MAHSVVADITTQEAAAISKRRWLHYSRRLPPEATDQYGYADSILDALTAICGSDTETDADADAGGYFTVNPGDGQVVYRVLTGVALLSELQRVYRLAGRGARFLISPEGLPVQVFNRSFDAAMATHEVRLRDFQKDGRLIPQLGTIVGELVVPRAEDYGRSVIAFFRAIEREWRVSAAPDSDDTGLGCLENYAPAVFSLEQLGQLLSDGRRQSLQVDPAVSTAIGFLAALGVTAIGTGQNLAHVRTFGFLQCAAEDVERMIAAGFQSASELLDQLGLSRSHLKSSTDLILEATRLPASIWPIRTGPVIRFGSNKAVLDLHGATAVFESPMVLSNDTGAVSNARAAHFEDAIQNLIDRTSWKPDDRLRSIRGRTLRVAGRSLTDIDAIGSSGERLLIVSCKGRVVNQGLEVGEYSSVRNAQTVAEDALHDLFGVVDLLRRLPQGDNFDISAFARIIGVVCVPQPIFLERRLSARLATTGLRAIAWPTELSQWLQNS